MQISGRLSREVELTFSEADLQGLAAAAPTVAAALRRAGILGGDGRSKSAPPSGARPKTSW